MIAISTQGDAVIADMADYPGRVSKAMVRALNRAIGSARTVIVREIARDMGLKSKDVRDALRMSEATMSRPESSLAARLKRIPLIDFNARGPEPSRGKGRGVSYRLPGGKGRAPNAFIATMGSGHRGVFARTGKARLGIRELKGPSIGHVFAKYKALGLAKAQESFETNFAHEMKFAGAAAGATDAG